MPARTRKTPVTETTVEQAAADLANASTDTMHAPVGDPYVDVAAAGGQAWHVPCTCGEVVMIPAIPAPGSNHTIGDQAQLKVAALAAAGEVIELHAAGLIPEPVATEPLHVEPPVVDPNAAGEPLADGGGVVDPNTTQTPEPGAQW